MISKATTGDLLVLCRAATHLIVINIEAKADEPFGDHIVGDYYEQKENSSPNVPASLSLKKLAQNSADWENFVHAFPELAAAQVTKNQILGPLSIPRGGLVPHSIPLYVREPHEPCDAVSLFSTRIETGVSWRRSEYACNSGQSQRYRGC